MRPQLFTIDYLGGWTKAQKKFFDPNNGTDDEDRAEPWRLTPPRSARPPRAAAPPVAEALGGGFIVGYLSLVVLLPLAALVAEAGNFRHAVTNREAVAALELTLVLAVAVALVNAVVGTATAWVLVRDDFRGKRLVNAVIDLPFALPTIVAGLTLLALYGPRGCDGTQPRVHARGRAARAAVRDAAVRRAHACSRCCSSSTARWRRRPRRSARARPAIFRRIVFPNLLPALLSGVALAFARAIGEFGAVVLISGNLPFKTEVASVYIFGRIQSNDAAGAAALSLVLLVISFAVLLAIGGLRRWATRHDR